MLDITLMHVSIYCDTIDTEQHGQAVRIEQVQVDVDKLTKGMYVCQLDRPWLSTPFPFQGFVINSEQDIKALKKYCAFVYVDILRGVPPEADSGLNKPWKPSDTSKRQGNDGDAASNKARAERASRPTRAAPIIKVDSNYYPEPKRFNKEMKVAEKYHELLSRDVSQIFDDIRVGRGLELKSVRESTKHMVESVIRHPDAFVWMAKLHQHHKYSYGHSIRSSILSCVLGRHLGFNEHKLDVLTLGALLSEIGKAKLPRSLLEKRTALDEEEVEKLREHVTMGVEILDRCPGISSEVIEIVQNHHERYNGSGYPNRLSGDEIPITASIAGLADCYDAMTSIKPYTDSVMTTSEATDYLYTQRDNLFQGQLIEEFIQALGIYPTGTLVELSTGEVGLIISQNVKQRIQPEILVVLNEQKTVHAKPVVLNLRKYNFKNEDLPISIVKALPSGEFGLDAGQLMETYRKDKMNWRKMLPGLG